MFLQSVRLRATFLLKVGIFILIPTTMFWEEEDWLCRLALRFPLKKLFLRPEADQRIPRQHSAGRGSRQASYVWSATTYPDRRCLRKCARKGSIRGLLKKIRISGRHIPFYCIRREERELFWYIVAPQNTCVLRIFPWAK